MTPHWWRSGLRRSILGKATLEACSDHGHPADVRSGESAPPRGDYTKWEMAEDVHQLLHEHLGLTDPAFVLSLDIGSMVATAYTSATASTPAHWATEKPHNPAPATTNASSVLRPTGTSPSTAFWTCPRRWCRR